MKLEGVPLLGLLGGKATSTSKLWDAWIETVQKVELSSSAATHNPKERVSSVCAAALTSVAPPAADSPPLHQHLCGYENPVGVVGVWVKGGINVCSDIGSQYRHEPQTDGGNFSEFVICRADDDGSLDALQRAVHASNAAVKKVRMEVNQLLERVCNESKEVSEVTAVI